MDFKDAYGLGLRHVYRDVCMDGFGDVYEVAYNDASKDGIRDVDKDVYHKYGMHTYGDVHGCVSRDGYMKCL